MGAGGAGGGMGLGSGAPTLDPTTGLPAGGIMTGVDPNSPMAQTANQIGIQAAGGPLTQMPAWKKDLGKAAQFANAWSAAAPQQQPQQPGQAVNFGVAPMPYIPPPTMGPGFYGG